MYVHPDLNAAVRAIVADEVRTALAPYRHLLDHLAAFLEQRPAPQRAGRPRQGPRVAARAGGGRRRKAGKTGPLVHDFAEGQTVRYRQGSGVFDAKIVGIEPESGTLLLARVSDGHEVLRPVAKVLSVA
jgi:hypothetical protein